MTYGQECETSRATSHHLTRPGFDGTGEALLQNDRVIASYLGI